jgi:LysM repeat protein
MKIKIWIKILSVVIIAFVFNSMLYSQVTVERSKDKVIIYGNPYYIHLVKKGQTAYSIAKAYGIAVSELTKENPPALYGVNEGQILRVPIKNDAGEVSDKTLVVKKSHDKTKYIYHNLRPGETVYFLSKSYGVSENEIIQCNPDIDINKLPVGSEIIVPRRQFMQDRRKFDNQEKEYIYHKVIEGESLSSIARQYEITIRMLKRENRDLRFPKVGDFVKVPGVFEIIAQEPELPDTVSVELYTDEPVINIAKMGGFIPVKDLSGSIDVAVLLPFYLKENAKRIEIDSSKFLNGKRVYNELKKTEDWIYPPSKDFVEMYEGILLAADTLRSLGLNINIHTYDIKSDTVGVTNLIKSGKLAVMDLIIGPVYSYNLSAVAAYARDFDIPVVSPVPLINNSALANNPTLFMANSSLEVSQKIISKKISEYYNYNFVFIHTDSSGVDKDVNRFKNLIFNELTQKIPYDEIRFKEFHFYSRSTFDNDSINRLSHALSEDSKNIIIIASEKAAIISEVVMDAHGLSRRFDIKVFGYPVMRDLDNLDATYFFDLGILIYSPYWIDYSKNDVKMFNSYFRQKFLTEPSERSYAWHGYDIAYYFISGLAMYGKEFIYNPGIHYPDLLQTDFDFRRKAPGFGFENQKLFPVRYTKEYDVKLFKEEFSLW